MQTNYQGIKIMTYKCSVKKNEVKGLTKAYGITEEMLLEEGSFEGWGWCREAFSYEFDEMDKEMLVGSIIIHDHHSTGLVIEGMTPYQQSNMGNPNYDMTYALIEMGQHAVRWVEECMLQGSYRLHSISDASIIDSNEYIKAVLQRIMELAADDNGAFLDYKLDDSDINIVISKLSKNGKTFRQGTGTLDFFARLDAFSAVLDYDFWVIHVGMAHLKALSLVEDSLLTLAARMGMGRVIFDKDGSSEIEDSSIAANIFNKKFGKPEGRCIDY